MRKISISLTDELDDALESVSIAQGTNKSRIIENYLREHKVISHYVDIIRSEPNTGAFTVSRKAVDESKKKAPIPA
jgi:metal-responsive CopG/Arc/MetJ family transcriptional regulator